MFANRHISALFAIVLALAGCATMPPNQTERVKVLAFTDTSSVRIDLSILDASALSDATVLATILPAEGGETLWSGEVGRLAVSGDVGTMSETLSGLTPRYWSPDSPQLYHLAVEVRTNSEIVRDTVRVGFRTFESRGGQLLLNGKPVFIRGNAINPPERMIPDSLEENRTFVEDYIRYLKSVGVNMIRSTRHSQVWFDVADELGMMYFQGNYGTPKDGSPTNPPEDVQASIEWYRNEVFEPLVNHPSIVIYVLSNEQASKDIGYLSRGADEVEAFLDKIYDAMSAWDSTRVYIGNAGYGLGRNGDITDIHRYWGWYYNSFLSFYTLRDPVNYWRGEPGQPITLSENTGNYTGPDGRFNLVPKSKQPESQLNWTGHAPNEEQAERALAHQAFVAKQAIEISRRIRPINHHVAGLMPFTVPFHEWATITRFADMKAKPVLEQFAISYQPVLLSWELWTTQVYAGSSINPVAHVVNDDDSKSDLKDIELRYTLSGPDGRVVAQKSHALGNLPYYDVMSRRINIAIPANAPTGSYTLAGEVRQGERTISQNSTSLFVASRDFAGKTTEVARDVVVHQPSSHLADALRRLGVRYGEVTDLSQLKPGQQTLVLAGSGAEGENLGQLRSFVASGGRVLYLEPDTATADLTWLPVGVDLRSAELDHEFVYPGGRPFRNGLAANPERPSHPVFDGVDRDRLYMWSDHTGWSEQDPGFPAVYPVTNGFILTNPGDLRHTAVLANYDHGLEGIALAEIFEGKGSVLLSGFGMLHRVGLDPVADRMLLNLVRYQASGDEHHPHPLVTEPIVWGDYGSEQGLVTGIYSGLLLNTIPIVPDVVKEKYPLVVDEEGFHFARSRGGWNTRPSIQYEPEGRRPFGPYEFTLGGSVRLPDDHADHGEGSFWLRVPEGRSTMQTTVRNPSDDALPLEVEVNGVRRQYEVKPHETATLETELRAADTSLAVTYRGDRRLVLLRTEFN